MFNIGGLMGGIGAVSGGTTGAVSGGTTTGSGFSGLFNSGSSGQGSSGGSTSITSPSDNNGRVKEMLGLLSDFFLNMQKDVGGKEAQQIQYSNNNFSRNRSGFSGKQLWDTIAKTVYNKVSSGGYQ